MPTHFFSFSIPAFLVLFVSGSFNGSCSKFALTKQKGSEQGFPRFVWRLQLSRIRGGSELGVSNISHTLASEVSEFDHDSHDRIHRRFNSGMRHVSEPVLLSEEEGTANHGEQMEVGGSDDNFESDELVDEEGLPMNSNYSKILNATETDLSAVRGCRHYSRGCQILAPCCNRLFWCRHCHNDEMDRGDPKKAHQLDRFTVTTVVCGKCKLEQKVQKNCEGCGNLFGEYFCSICKFFDDDISKGVFHCEGCGICRVGGRDNFFHCSACGCCYAVQLRSNHKCIAGAMHHNCPVCLENLFHSTSQVRVLRCGHTLHKKCLEQLLERPSTLRTCPLCSKTIVDHQFTWQQLDLAVAETGMPEEYRNMTVDMMCNDCGAKDRVQFHVVGLKCPNPMCGGYNTKRV